MEPEAAVGMSSRMPLTTRFLCTRIHAGQPQTNGLVERVQYYSEERAHRGRHTEGRTRSLSSHPGGWTPTPCDFTVSQDLGDRTP